MHKVLFLFLVAAGLMGGCVKPMEPSPETIQKIQQNLAPFKKQLQETLLGAMKQGPAHAVEVCSDRAAKIAIEASKPGFAVGRSTDKPRNPNNKAYGWQHDAITYFASIGKLEGATFSRRMPSGAIAYAEPITMGPVCLTCHGKNVENELQEKIRARYPQDQATGYEAGQLRGIFWAVQKL